jgi:hypothetical protein
MAMVHSSCGTVHVSLLQATLAFELQPLFPTLQIDSLKKCTCVPADDSTSPIRWPIFKTWFASRTKVRATYIQYVRVSRQHWPHHGFCRWRYAQEHSPRVPPLQIRGIVPRPRISSSCSLAGLSSAALVSIMQKYLNIHIYMQSRIPRDRYRYVTIAPTREFWRYWYHTLFF